MRAFSLVVLLTAAHGASIPLSCPATANGTCTTNIHCSLNGMCVSGACVCDAGWTGACCGQLNLAPVDYAATGGGYRHPNTSTWGGNIIRNASSGAYSMWIAEMKPKSADGSGSCGLSTWASNSQITHVMSASALGGPYLRQEVAVYEWSHNPIVRQAPDGTLVMWHIGGGGGSANSTLPKGFCAANGTSPCGEQDFDKCGSAPNPCNATAVPGYACHPGTCMGAGGSCGPTLAEPLLACDPKSWAGCITAAAAACAATPGCAAFSLSDAWIGLNHAKLFSQGAVTTVNGQWASWTALPVPAAPAAAGSCTLKMHTASSSAGPWTPYTEATITPCGGNNPGPWVHPNGTVFIVFTEQHMGLWRADTWRGPYTLVSTGACGGGEDPSLFLNARGEFHCTYHRSPFGKCVGGLRGCLAPLLLHALPTASLLAPTQLHARFFLTARTWL